MVSIDDLYREAMNARFRNYYSWRGYWNTTYTRQPTEKELLILGLCYGEAYNRWPELKLWDRENRIRLDQETKDKIVDFLKQMYKYYSERLKDQKVK